MNVADRIQLQSQPAHAAIEGAAQALRELLATGRALTLEQQLGLWGELWVLRQVAERSDWGNALKSWISSDAVAEEHDFALSDVDVEVKTTQREQRHHHVSSATQFLPKKGRALFIASIQVTGGGSAGSTLGELVAETKAECPRRNREALDKKLSSHGWRDADADRYPSRWLLRNAPMLIAADQLPRIDVHGKDRTRVVALSYVVDVSGLGRPFSEGWVWLK